MTDCLVLLFCRKVEIMETEQRRLETKRRRWSAIAVSVGKRSKRREKT